MNEVVGCIFHFLHCFATVLIPPVQGVVLAQDDRACEMIPLYVLIYRSSELIKLHESISAEAFIGRHEECEIRLSSELVSRKHAVVLRTEADVRLRDLSSVNGTLINGKRLQGEQILTHGDIVDIKPYSLRIFLGTAPIIRELAFYDDSTHRNPPPLNDAPLQPPMLTIAQRRVGDLFAEGLTEKEIAIRLGISIHTVHDHAKDLYKALDVSTRGALVSYWLKAQNK